MPMQTVTQHYTLDVSAATCRYFKEINRPIDFYLVPNPAWLDAKFPQQAKQVKRPCMALVSTDEQWMT
jgi:hypothetical protein